MAHKPTGTALSLTQPASRYSIRIIPALCIKPVLARHLRHAQTDRLYMPLVEKHWDAFLEMHKTFLS